MNKNISFGSSSFEQKLAELEQQEPQTFLDINPQACGRENLRFTFNYLYHGIRSQKQFEILESIFRDNAILAGNYQKDYRAYSDNCNEGEYISLLSTDGYYDIEYEEFILPNITLIISPECNAVKTLYLPYHEWEQVHDKKTKNRYSYAHNEYQAQQRIDLSMIKAIGLPARYLRTLNKAELVDDYLNDILELMHKYGVALPVVDTSAYNGVIILSPEYLIKNSKTKRKRTV